MIHVVCAQATFEINDVDGKYLLDWYMRISLFEVICKQLRGAIYHSILIVPLVVLLQRNKD
jgi:hypothetical protein